MTGHLLPVLAADDDESDQMILQIAFQRAGIRNPLIFVCDGEEVIEYLAGAGRFADRSEYTLPGLIILDLKMPRLNGFDVLSWLAVQPEFNEVPVVVVSSSFDETDICRARKLGARDYFVKPHALSDLVNIARKLQAKWLDAPE